MTVGQQPPSDSCPKKFQSLSQGLQTCSDEIDCLVFHSLSRIVLNTLSLDVSNTVMLPRLLPCALYTQLNSRKAESPIPFGLVHGGSATPDPRITPSYFNVGDMCLIL